MEGWEKEPPKEKKKKLRVDKYEEHRDSQECWYL